MPPGVAGHYRPNLSNPYNHFSQSHNSHAASSHYQNQPSISSFHSQPFGGNGFPAPTGHQNGNVNLFGSGLSNGVGNFGGALGGPAGGLASTEAQMGFARGAMQQQGQLHGQDGMGSMATRGSSRIREVWKGNLYQEMAMIRNLVDRYPFVSMDTEFPGVVARPMGSFPSKADYHYQCLRCNVDLLKLIQLGITLFSVEGELPPAQADTPLNRTAYSNNLVMCPCTWTFNFQFSLTEDMYSQDSIDMLQKAGVDFAKSEEMGIDPKEFGSLLITSGLVLDPSISWLSFHSGYDFGYLVKIMARQQLPNDEESYLKIVHTWFPRIYDIKYLFRHAQRLQAKGTLGQTASNVLNALGQRSGLQDIANELGCQREGRPHTAGSDAWLTGLVFWAMRNKIFDGNVPDDLVGQIWGLSGVGPPASAASQAAVLAGQQTPATNGATLAYPHTGMTPTTMRTEGPSTPQTEHSGLASTPGQHYGGGMAGLTSGAFNFQYGR